MFEVTADLGRGVIEIIGEQPADAARLAAMR